MKRSKTTIVLVILFCLIIGLIVFLMFYSKNIKSLYIKNLNEVEYRKNNFLYQDSFLFYFNHESKYPVNIDEAMLIKPDNPDYNIYLDSQLKDYLNKESALIQYIPVYDKANLRINAFLLVSAGIDGKIDNNITKDDTIFIDDFDKKLNFYNISSIQDSISLRPSDKGTKFNIFDYFFGKKDYLISYINFHDYYRSQVRKNYLLQSLIDQVLNYNYSGDRSKKTLQQVYEYTGIYSHDTIMNDTTYVCMQDDEYIVRSRLLCNKNICSSEGDSITLIGLLSNINTKSKIIDFKNCFCIKSEN